MKGKGENAVARQVSRFPSKTPLPLYGPVARPIEHQYSAEATALVVAPSITTEVERFLLVGFCLSFFFLVLKLC